MSSYFALYTAGILGVGFTPNVTADNSQIVRDVTEQLEMLAASGAFMGPILRVNGPASLPAAFVIAHKVAHLFGAVGVFDPKLGKYVICITHNPDYKLGDQID